MTSDTEPPVLPPADGDRPVIPDETTIPRPSWWRMPGEQPEPPLVFYGPPVPSPFAGLSIRPARIVSTALDLLAQANAQLRQGSFYVGLLVLGTAAPAVLLTWRIFDSIGGIDPELLVTSAPGLIPDAAALPWALAIAIAFVGLFVASIESRAVVMTVLAARLAGRRIDVRDAVQRSRTIFWPLFWANVLAAIPLNVLQTVLVEVTSGIFGRETEGAILSAALASVVLVAPLAYVQAGVVLGDVGAVESVKRSIRIYNARRLVGTAVALFEFGAQFITIFAISSGLDLVIRFFDATGFDPAGGTMGTAVVVALIVALLFATGTLLFTIAALAVVPQVVAFVALTHAAPGLDRIGKGDGLRFRWLPRPMLAAMIVAGLSLAAGALGLA